MLFEILVKCLQMLFRLRSVPFVRSLTFLPLTCPGFGCYFAPNSSERKIVKSLVGGNIEKQKRFECSNANCGIESHRLMSSEHQPVSLNRSARHSRLVSFHTTSQTQLLRVDRVLYMQFESDFRESVECIFL